MGETKVKIVELSPAEMVIIELFRTGKRNYEIADQLCIVEKTVKYHMTNIYRKAGLTAASPGKGRWLISHWDEFKFQLAAQYGGDL